MLGQRRPVMREVVRHAAPLLHGNGDGAEAQSVEEVEDAVDRPEGPRLVAIVLAAPNGDQDPVGLPVQGNAANDPKPIPDSLLPAGRLEANDYCLIAESQKIAQTIFAHYLGP